MASSKKTSGKVSDYYNDKDTHNWYNQLWGEGNIHFGYFGSDIGQLIQNAKSNQNALQHISYPTVAAQATLRLSNIGCINSNSVVLDLGCGYGKSAAKISSHTSCKMVIGLDLSTLHIEKAKQMAQNIHKQNKLKFVCGSFTDFPDDVMFENCDAFYSHILSEAALCHCHTKLDTIIKQCKKVLNPQHGKMIINDVISNQEASKLTKQYVYDRMQFDYLVSTQEYMDILRQNGFRILYFEEFSPHLWLSYKLLIYNAMKHKECERFKDLIIKYEKTCESIERDEYGMINIVAEIHTKSKI